MPSSGGFREVKNVKIWFLGHNFMANVAGATNTYEAQSRNMIKHCTKYGLISYYLLLVIMVMVETDNTRRTTNKAMGMV